MVKIPLNVEDKEFLSRIRNLYGGIMQNFCHFLKKDYDIGAIFYLVGSGARNLIVQNASLPVDLDYNLEIVRCEDYEACRFIKECARNPTEFSMDACIVCRDTEECYHRLIHEKTGFTGKWPLVRTQYLDIKNRYLLQNDYNHPSFICYIEAVNNVYNARRSWK